MYQRALLVARASSQHVHHQPRRMLDRVVERLRRWDELHRFEKIHSGVGVQVEHTLSVRGREELRDRLKELRYALVTRGGREAPDRES